VLESERLRALASRFSVGHRRDASPDELGPGVGAPIAATAEEPDPDVHPEAVPPVHPDEWVLGRADIRTVDLLAMSFETMSALISRYRMASNPPDVLVTVPSNAVGTLDFHRAAEMIELGRRLMTEALDRAGY
jgi:NTE family protein